MQITEIQLKALVERLSLSIFNAPFNHQVIFNNHLRTTGGRVVFPRIGRKVLQDKIRMEINPKLIGDDLEDVVKHELTHYHLFLKKGIHRENDPQFQAMLRQIQAPRYSPLHRRQKSFYVYECENPAHHQYSRNRKIDIKKMRCGFDGSKLRLIMERHI
ncbi:MAG: SprT family protein [Lactobacillaceae bacterium]|jgi:SprT-like protein|nr:SprT family protein [Lactobacillaceae bacterium]